MTFDYIMSFFFFFCSESKVFSIFVLFLTEIWLKCDKITSTVVALIAMTGDFLHEKCNLSVSLFVPPGLR
jgi:hypothetical protein